KGDKGEKGDTGDKGDKGDQGKSAYETWKDQKDDQGNQPNKDKSEKEFLDGLKGDKGEKGDTGDKGDKGDQGKSAYETWKEQKDDQGEQPNKDKTEKDFLDSLKGKDGKDGVGGAAVEAGTNISVDKKDPTKTVVSLKDNIDVKSVKVGDVTIKDNKITGIAPGEISKDSKDAVNGSQLFATNQQVANNMYQINNLRDESREGDALGAAMAALKPIDFDPYQRSQIMAGVGYYRGKEAVALGLAHYKNEDLMFHGGLAYAGNSELMANIGVTYRFGSKDDRDIKHDRNLRMPQYAEGPISSVYILQDEVDRLTKENKEANDRIAALEAKLEKVLEKVK
ncbi:MAG: YadA-like family protein, partial [Dialister sp.]|nr:YadA-like family protein [Dialister sp.]